MAIYEYAQTADGQGYNIWFHYDPDLVQAIKQIPHTARRWESEEKVWYVDRNWFNDACRYLDHIIRRNTGRTSDFGRERKPEERQEQRQERKSSNSDKTWNDWNRNMWGSSDSTSRPKTHFDTLHLLPDAPLPVIKAAYGALAKIHHPDCGGSEERMKQINLAYEKAVASAKG